MLWKRLTSSMPMHVLPILLNNGVPVALCSDDPAVFGNMGLTFDFFQVRRINIIARHHLKAALV
jgi:adenosine deaminase